MATRKPAPRATSARGPRPPKRRRPFVYYDDNAKRQSEAWVGVRWTGPWTVEHARRATENDARCAIGLQPKKKNTTTKRTYTR
jgi:hypothetical protein